MANDVRTQGAGSPAQVRLRMSANAQTYLTQNDRLGSKTRTSPQQPRVRLPRVQTLAVLRRYDQHGRPAGRGP
jgi:hypothetical protein